MQAANDFFYKNRPPRKTGADSRAGTACGGLKTTPDCGIILDMRRFICIPVYREQQEGEKKVPAGVEAVL